MKVLFQHAKRQIDTKLTLGLEVYKYRLREPFLFNEVLSARLNMKNWATYLPGDVLNLDGTESYFFLEENDQHEKIKRTPRYI